MGDDDTCSDNLTSPSMPFMHPRFVFVDPTYKVRVRLGKRGEKPFYDASFAGPPGNDYTIPTNAPPAAGKLPLFPEFCQPIDPDAVYTLRLTEQNKDFDEELHYE